MSGPEVDKEINILLAYLKVMDCLLRLKQSQKLITSLEGRKDKPLYIKKNSNQPPTIIKQMPNAISKRVSVISSSKEIYDEHIGYYKDALKHSGYDNTSLWYNSTQQQRDNQIKKKSINAK